MLKSAEQKRMAPISFNPKEWISQSEGRRAATPGRSLSREVGPCMGDFWFGCLRPMAYHKDKNTGYISVDMIHMSHSISLYLIISRYERIWNDTKNGTSMWTLRVFLLLKCCQPSPWRCALSFVGQEGTSRIHEKCIDQPATAGMTSRERNTSKKN